MSISRVYTNINSTKPREYWEYEKFSITWGEQDNYELVNKIGRGKYSDVFSGVDVVNNKSCVIKILKPVKKSKIKREIKILINLAGGPNIVRLYDVVKTPGTNMPCLIFEHINGLDFKSYIPSLKEDDIKYYMYQLLLALNHAHSQGIMHRDVKPGNIVLDHNNKNIRLIDWGLAEFYHPNTQYNVRVATRHYKGPELLVEYEFYDYSLDMWSFGCMFGAIIFKKEVLFNGNDNLDQMVKIVRVLGSKDYEEYLETYQIVPLQKLTDMLGHYQKKDWNKFITDENKSLATKDAVSLLHGLLKYDHQKRLSATEALAHPYFESLHPK
jgi:casein kinase II subunit alpha